MSHGRIVKVATGLLTLSALLLSTAGFAAESRMIEEVTVTAQRVEESIQEVPIAVSALTGDMLEDQGILMPSDLQMNAPSVSFTATNFGGSSFSIRGIGNLVIGGESGVSQHINEIAVGTNLNSVEFYDMERVEILRGPQGTLFGRNATGGAINFVTRKPDFDGIGGFVDVEMGDYSNQRVKAALNLPIGERFAVRFAGMDLSRDGYITNRAAGQVGTDGSTIPNIDDDVDGRDISTFRATARWDITDDMDLWVMYYNFDEDDDRARITNQVCKATSIPTLGCDPNAFGFDNPHLLTTTGGLFAAIYGGLLPLAASGPITHPKPADMGLRDMHTDFEPVWKEEEDTYAFGFNWALDSFTIGLSGAYQEREYLQRQDYLMDVGFTLPFAIPVDRPAGGPGDDWRDGPCNYLGGTAGAFGGCVLESTDGSRVFAYDQSDSVSEYYTWEAKVSSNFEGPFNFVLGAMAYEGEAYGDYYVLANTLQTLGLYPGHFNNTSEPTQPGRSSGEAVFGEMYFEATDALRITLGLRFNDDKRESYGTSTFVNSVDIGGGTIVRSALAGFLGGAALGDSTALALLYGVTQAQIDAANASAVGSAERLAVATGIPPIPRAGETRALTGSPTEFSFDEVSGRVGFDWQLGDASMIYAFLSRGYKPGGLNPAIPVDFQDTSSFSYAPEEIDAIEIGSKNTFLDGTLVMNGAFYYYSYGGLQVTRIVNNSSLNDNIDSKIWGLELEGVWNPDALPNVTIDYGYSYTKAEVDGSSSIDPSNRSAGDPAWTILKNFDPGAAAGTTFIARTAEITPTVIGTCAGLGGTIPLPHLSYDNGIPALWSRNCLSAFATTSDGLEQNLDGNSLPNTPEHTINFGVAYRLPMEILAGSLTARWDYYWQGEMYAREFNTSGDEIDSWDQHNLQLIYESTDGRWTGRLFVRNVQDEDNITGHYLTSDTSGFYRNYFLTEPRIWGASVRYTFNGM